MLRRTRNLGLLLAGILVGAAGVATASHDPDVIHACVADSNGAVRIVADPADCRPSETAIEWSIQGPQGPPGPPGIASVQVRSELVTVADGGSGAPTAFCEEGEIRTGGGGAWHLEGDAAFASDPALELVGSFPEPLNEAWTAIGHNSSGAAADLEAFAVCAELAAEE